MDNSQFQVIPLRACVYCADCECVTDAVGNRCPVCGSPGLYRLSAWLEDTERSRKDEKLTMRVSAGEC